MKEERASKQGQRKKIAWRPILQDIGMYAIRGFVTGVSMKLGGVAVDKMTRSRQASLTLVRGGRSVANG